MTGSSSPPSSPLRFGQSPALIAAVMLVGPSLIFLLSFADASGVYIPTGPMSFDYLIALVVGIFLFPLALAWPMTRDEMRGYSLLWAVKLLTCLVLMLPYEARYDFLDAYYYYTLSLEPNKTRESMQLAFGTKGIIEVFAAFWLVFPPSYHLAKVLFAYCGLAAIFLFYRAFRLMRPGASVAPLYLLGLFPSMLFWSSIPGKDPLILLGLSMATYGALAWFKQQRRTALLLLFVGVIVTAYVRPWVGGIAFIAAIATQLLDYMRRRSWAKLSLSVAAISVAVYVGVRIAIDKIDADFILTQLQDVSSSWAIGGSAVNAPLELNSWADVVVFLPKGMFTAFFRPLPGEVANAFGALAGLENVVLLAACALTIARQRRWMTVGNGVFYIILFILGWALIYAFLSYQNLGTATRFKVQVLPFLLLLFLVSVDSGRQVNRKLTRPIQLANKVAPHHS
jgi:hypothetical protein